MQHITNQSFQTIDKAGKKHQFVFDLSITDVNGELAGVDDNIPAEFYSYSVKDPQRQAPGHFVAEFGTIQNDADNPLTLLDIRSGKEVADTFAGRVFPLH